MYRRAWSLAAALMVVTVVAAPAQTTAAPVSDSDSLTFLTFNVCKSNCASPAPSWDVRRDRVARVIVESNADIVGIQEATNWGVTAAKTQWADIENLVAPAGYVSPQIPDDFNPCTYAKGGVCTNSPRLLFKSNAVTQMTTSNGLPAAGYVTLGDISEGIEASAASRAVAWAYFESPASGQFLALSIHMPTDKTTSAESARVVTANQLSTWVQKLNLETGLAIGNTVLMADLNSYAVRQPQGAQAVLATDGWSDAWNAPKRRNIYFSTINITPDTKQYGGWTPKPRKFKRPATRIDYIMNRGSARFTEYEVMIWLQRDGKFNPDYQASDHQAVRAVLTFR